MLKADFYFVRSFFVHSQSLLHKPSLLDKMETNLAATTAARKERLIALRKRKEAVEQGEGANGEP
jgi:hypothetical protein